MKIMIRKENKHGEVYASYETSCLGAACDSCVFRFRCFTVRDWLDVYDGELDDLSLRMVAGGELLELIHRHLVDREYYTLIFWKIVKNRNMNVGYVPLLANTRWSTTSGDPWNRPL